MDEPEKPFHVEPLNDVREHITNGDPCPCMPSRHPNGRIVHHSYDARETGEVCRKALDALALVVTDLGHTWTDELRYDYEHAITVLNMHWPAKTAETKRGEPE